MYGLRRFADDIELMTGSRPHTVIFSHLLFYNKVIFLYLVLDAMLEIRKPTCNVINSFRLIHESNNQRIKLSGVGVRTGKNWESRWVLIIQAYLFPKRFLFHRMAPLVHLRRRSSHRCFSLVDSRRGDLSVVGNHYRWGHGSSLVSSGWASRR